jgi:hypothetical protein
LRELEHIGLEAVHASAVIPSGHCGPHDEPEDEPNGGQHDAPGEAGVCLCVEVQDRPHPAEHLPERLEAGGEAEERRQCLHRDGAARRCQRKVDEQEHRKQLPEGAKGSEQGERASRDRDACERHEEPELANVGSVHVKEPDRDQEQDAGQDRHGDQRHRPFRQQRLPPADGDRHSLPPSGANLACAVPQRGVDAGVDENSAKEPAHERQQ